VARGETLLTVERAFFGPANDGHTDSLEAEMLPPTNHRPAEHSASDADLIQRAQEGDRSAFAELYSRHAASVTRLVRARTGSADVDDAVAETFARAWKSIRRYKFTGSPFVAWLYGISRNIINDGHRKAGRMKVDEAADLASLPDADAGLEKVADLIDLGAAISQLNRRQRKVIELKYLAGLNNDEVGSALGMAPGAVNTLQWRALRKLQLILEADG